MIVTSVSVLSYKYWHVFSKTDKMELNLVRNTYFNQALEYLTAFKLAGIPCYERTMQLVASHSCFYFTVAACELRKQLLLAMYPSIFPVIKGSHLTNQLINGWCTCEETRKILELIIL